MAGNLSSNNNIGETVTTCPSDCKQAYQQVLDEVEEVKRSTFITTPRLNLFPENADLELLNIQKRNKKINEKYEQLYKDMPYNRWVGLAAIVSSQVGCNMNYLSLGNASRLPYISNNSMEALRALGEGNMAIFQSAYPPLRMAANCGTKKFLECVDKGEISPPDDMVTAIRQFDEGDNNGAINTIINFEQNKIAPPIYEKHKGAFEFMNDSAKAAKNFGVDMESLPLSTKCGASNTVPFSTDANPRTILNADDRISYFFDLNKAWDGIIRHN